MRYQKDIFFKNTTENELSKKSFVENFLQSIKEKMYGKVDNITSGL